ncbi:hypothetical protein F5Y16DRAFT_419100 [Xylariaceae sp. FL0255]|nr:hypothetical protein F5Y16DRAFT_419100 [Xylariaceae sp. FL0255]
MFARRKKNEDTWTCPTPNCLKIVKRKKNAWVATRRKGYDRPRTTAKNASRMALPQFQLPPLPRPGVQVPTTSLPAVWPALKDGPTSPKSLVASILQHVTAQINQRPKEYKPHQSHTPILLRRISLSTHPQFKVASIHITPTEYALNGPVLPSCITMWTMQTFSMTPRFQAVPTMRRDLTRMMGTRQMAAGYIFKKSRSIQTRHLGNLDTEVSWCSAEVKQRK